MKRAAQVVAKVLSSSRRPVRHSQCHVFQETFLVARPTRTAAFSGRWNIGEAVTPPALLGDRPGYGHGPPLKPASARAASGKWLSAHWGIAWNGKDSRKRGRSCVHRLGEPGSLSPAASRLCCQTEAERGRVCPRPSFCPCCSGRLTGRKVVAMPVCAGPGLPCRHPGASPGVGAGAPGGGRTGRRRRGPPPGPPAFLTSPPRRVEFCFPE